MSQWCREWGGGQPIHVYPLNDLREHVTDGCVCWCQPVVDEQDGMPIVIHNSLDGREAFEIGERKPS